MKVAVTGATGFIGRHVLDELARRAVETVAVARSFPDKAQALPCASTVRLDINDVPVDTFETIGCPDVLIHLAWDGLPNYQSLNHFEHELPAQYRFLKSLVKSGLRTLVVAGTCFEYGMQSGPLSEDMEPRPSNPYGFAKDMLRRQLEYLKVTHSFALVWSRLFYLYGEGQAESSLFPQLKKAVERGDAMFDMSGGEQLRDYLPVTEAARHVVDLALQESDVGIINICAGRPISVRKLVEGWLSENGWSISVNLGHYPYPDYEPMAFWGDAQKFFSIIGKAT
jgi:nucleoside-diphosphate-sugar epimerase